MRIHPDSLVDREPEDLAALSITDVRTWREALQQVEYGYSYARRVVQGRLDTLLGELERRRTGAPDADLVEVIPETLGQKIRGPGLPRPTRDLEPPDWADELVAELEEIVPAGRLAGLHELDVDTLADAAQRISTLEHELSQARSLLHERIDRVQAELISRYREGAGVEDLLT